MSQPKEEMISVIIPTYNRCEMLCQCIDSILESTFKNFEIIVVDNASTDGTEKAIKERFLEKHRNVFYHRNSTNEMSSVARNTGMRMASGSWFLLLDDDNLVLPDMFEKLLECSRNHPELGLIVPLPYNVHEQEIWTLGGDMNWYTARYKEKHTELFRGKKLQLEDIDRLGLAECYPTSAVAPNALMVRREAAERIGGFNTAYRMNYDDTDFCIRITRAGMRAAICATARTRHMHAPAPGDETVLRRLGIHKVSQTFLLTRNRSWMVKYFAPWYCKLIYFALFVHIPGLYYALQALLHARPDCALAAIKGTWTGIFTSPPPPPGASASCSRGEG